MFEFTAATGVVVHPNGVALVTPDDSSSSSSNSSSSAPGEAPADGAGGAPAAGPSAQQGTDRGAEGECGSITGRLLIDCMGNFSPIVRQVRG